MMKMADIVQASTVVVCVRVAVRVAVGLGVGDISCGVISWIRIATWSLA